MTKLFLALLAALITAHVGFDVSVAAGVLTTLAAVVCFGVIDGAAAVARKLRGARPSKSVMS